MEINVVDGGMVDFGKVCILDGEGIEINFFSIEIFCWWDKR